MRHAVHLVRSVGLGLPLNAARGHTLFSSGLLIPGMICPSNCSMALLPHGRTHVAPTVHPHTLSNMYDAVQCLLLLLLLMMMHAVIYSFRPRGTKFSLVARDDWLSFFFSLFFSPGEDAALSIEIDMLNLSWT